MRGTSRPSNPHRTSNGAVPQQSAEPSPNQGTADSRLAESLLRCAIEATPIAASNTPTKVIADSFQLKLRDLLKRGAR